MSNPLGVNFHFILHDFQSSLQRKGKEQSVQQQTLKPNHSGAFSLLSAVNSPEHPASRMIKKKYQLQSAV